MRKVVLIMTASIDGYVAGPSGNAVGAHPEPAELKRWKLERIRRAGTLDAHAARLSESDRA